MSSFLKWSISEINNVDMSCGCSFLFQTGWFYWALLSDSRSGELVWELEQHGKVPFCSWCDLQTDIHPAFIRSLGLCPHWPTNLRPQWWDGRPAAEFRSLELGKKHEPKRKDWSPREELWLVVVCGPRPLCNRAWRQHERPRMSSDAAGLQPSSKEQIYCLEWEDLPR